MQAQAKKWIAILTLIITLLTALQLNAQLRQGTAQVRYVVIDLGTLGGTQGVAEGISNKGWVVGDANLAGDQNGHAFLWRDGVMTDLGTLGGPNSQEQWPVNDSRGVIVGSSETSDFDPYNEDFCGFDSNAGIPATGLICQAFVWQNEIMTALPTLGGNNSQALGVNNLGQIVGFAEQNTQDMNCIPPQVLDIQAVVWGPNPGELHRLPPLPGDISAWAIGINDAGHIVGLSGNCVSPNFNAPGATTPQHAVVWRNGTVTNIGTIGGSYIFPYAINAKGAVVGQASPPGDATIHTFLWQNGLMRDLGVVAGDVLGGAFGLNNQGEVVGGSCGPNVTVGFGCRAYLWREGVMTDLNSLVKPGSTALYLVFGNDINSKGEIAAYAIDQSNGEFHAALAIPCDERHADNAACSQATINSAVAVVTSNGSKMTFSENIRDRMQRRMLLPRR